LVAVVRGVEAYEGSLDPKGYRIDVATSPDNDPDNPNGTGYFRAGVPVTDPDGVTTWGPIINLAEKARLDRMDAYREALGENANVNGVTFPVVLVPREKREP
ncbi:MAG: hypothetical protein V4755_06225, partial [Curtobacterium sp.]